MRKKAILSWIVRLIAAIILLQTLFFKFTAAPEPVAIFSKLGVEPWGRIATGIFELTAAILLLIPATSFFGALLGTGIMAGAILSHLFIIGIDSAGDGGMLFILGVITLTCCMVEMLIRYKKYFPINRRKKVYV